MENILIPVIAAIALLLFGKGSLLRLWIFFFSTVFAVYIAIFLAPLLNPLIPAIPQAEGYRIPALMLGVTILLLIILHKTAEGLLESLDNMERFKFPGAAEKIGKLLLPFSSGGIFGALLILCFAMTPVSKEIKALDSQAMRSSAMLVLKPMIGTVNAFSMQPLSREASDILAKLEAGPEEKKQSLEELLKKKKEKQAKKPVRKSKKVRLNPDGTAVPVK